MATVGGLLLVLATACCVGLPWGRDRERRRPPASAPSPDLPRAPTVPPGPFHPNVLLVILDDVGQDRLAPWGRAVDPSPTPTIDSLVADGLLFHNAYAAPVCQAGRAALLTGRWAHRTGVGSNTDPRETGWTLGPNQGTLPLLLQHHGWRTALVGKWHLATMDTPDPLRDPLRRGFEGSRGTFANVLDRVRTKADGTYTSWERIEDGKPHLETRYVTTVQVDDAIAYTRTLTEPWLIWFAPNAAHDPWAAPPESLVPGPPAQDPVTAYRATLTAFDVELGRLLDALPADTRKNTLIVLVADNGTPKRVIPPPFRDSRGKTTLFDGGTLIPMVWTGPGVTPGETAALVHLIDVLPTLADLFDMDVTWSPYGPQIIDGLSFAPVLTNATAPARPFLITEDFQPNGDPKKASSRRVAVRDSRYKLIRDLLTGKEMLFRYTPNAIDEGPDLLRASLDSEATSARARLGGEIDKFNRDVSFNGP